MSGAVVLLSGGLDSTICLSRALTQHSRVWALSVYYGQKNARELVSRDRVVEFYQNRYNRKKILLAKTVALSLMMFEGVARKSPLLVGGPELDRPKDYDEVAQGVGGANVPFRNGLFVSLATAFAQGEDCGEVWLGVTGEGARDYPDCSQEFLDGMRQAVRMGTAGAVQLVTPFSNMTKAQVVEAGLREGIPWELTWSCYDGKSEPCGTCQACIEREDAFRKALPSASD